MTYASVCDGISAVRVAWAGLPWTCSWVSEIEGFCNAVTSHRFKDSKQEAENLGDLLKIKDPPPYVDLLVGGTPCQSFSIAGQRKGLADERGNLTMAFFALAERIRPRWIVWENVPGVLSIDKGRVFGTVLGQLEKFGYGWAYRVLDAQHFGVPQRRRRVFIVANLGSWQRAASVLFERESLRGDTAESKEAGKEVAGTLGGRSNRGSLEGYGAFVTGAVTSKWAKGSGGPSGGPSGDECQNLVPVQVQWASGGGKIENDTAQALRSNAETNYQFVRNGSTVRRLTPRECERLQGFPDDFTLVPYRGKPASDSPRYSAIGNSMAVPVMKWIGEGIEAQCS